MFLPLQIFATYYYVKNDGNDNANGLSDATAWATINKVNNTSLNAGDSVLFKCGDVWRELIPLVPKSGNHTNGHIVYSNYGTGEKPLFLNSKQENLITDWEDIGGNLWRNSDPAFSAEVGNIIFNDYREFGIRVYSLNAVNSSLKYYYNSTNKTLTLYCAGNPASVYDNIECVLKSNYGKIYINNKNYIVIDGLAIKNEARHGISSSRSNNIIIRNCEISYIGGAMAGSTLRLGNGIEFWADAGNILIEQNYVGWCYDAGITSQYMPQNTAFYIDSFIIRYNIIEHCEFNFEWWYWNEIKPGTSVGFVNGFYYENNTSLNAGIGWSDGQRPGNTRGAHVTSGWKDAVITRAYIRNNIFVNATEAAIRQAYYWLPVINYDNNIYYNVNRIGYISNSDYYTLEQWQSATGGKDMNSINADPKLNTNFTLQSNSPAIDAGATLGYTCDFFGNPVPNGSFPDIGAVEYYGIPE